MNRQEHITRAKLIDGKVLIEQADGSYRVAEDRTDHVRLASFTEEDIERMAMEDDTADDVPESVRVTALFETVK